MSAAPYPDRPPGEPWLSPDHEHQWTRTGSSAGTGFVMRGPWRCWCGAALSEGWREVTPIEREERHSGLG